MGQFSSSSFKTFSPASISILTWRAPHTLYNTLTSLAPILHIFSNHYVVCQEGDPDEVQIARQFGFTPITTGHNLGIQEGLARCAEVSATETVLVMEGDCILSSPENAPAVVLRCLNALSEQHVDIFQLHERATQPTPSYWRFWKRGLPLRPTMLGRLRPSAAMAKTSEAVCLSNFPHDGIPNITPLGAGMFVASSNCVNWCNRSFLTTKDFFLDKVVRFARENPTSRKVNGLPDLEHPINCRANREWWRGEMFKVGILFPGLFGHHRTERPEGDEKVRRE